METCSRHDELVESHKLLAANVKEMKDAMLGTIEEPGGFLRKIDILYTKATEEKIVKKDRKVFWITGFVTFINGIALVAVTWWFEHRLKIGGR